MRGFILLNILRICSILALVCSIVAACTTLILSFKVTKFFFFDAINQLVLSGICIFLVLSECSLAPAYYSRNWPLFSEHASLVWQGLAEVGVGLSLLGNLNEGFASKQSMGSFNTLLTASGVVVTVIGVFTFVASFVYRARDPTVSARMVRSFRLRRKEYHSGSDTESVRFKQTISESVPMPTTPPAALQLPTRENSQRSQYTYRSEPRKNNTVSETSFYKQNGQTIPSTGSSCSGSFSDARIPAERYRNELRP